MKVVNLPAPTKNGSVSRSAKPKFAKKGDDSSKTFSEIFPYKGDLPLISNIIAHPILLDEPEAEICSLTSSLFFIQLGFSYACIHHFFQPTHSSPISLLPLQIDVEDHFYLSSHN